MNKTGYYYLFVIGVMVWSAIANAQTGDAVLQQQIGKTDSLLMKLLITPEVYRKDNAPVDDIFHRLMEQHPEFLTLIRTNAKGKIVNVVSKDDSAAIPGRDVTKNAWFSNVRKTLKPYYSPIIQGHEHYSIIWSKPLVVKNTLGLDMFGGAVAVEINIAVLFKQFATTFREPFKVFLNGKEFFYVTWYDNILFEDKPVSIPGVTGFTLRYIKNRETAKSLMSDPDTTQQQAATVSASSHASASQTSALVSSVELPKALDNTAPISAFDYFVTNRTLQLYSIAVLVVLLLLTIVYSNKKKKRNTSSKSTVKANPMDTTSNHEPAADMVPRSLLQASSVNNLRQRIQQQEMNKSASAGAPQPFSTESSSFILAEGQEELEVVAADADASLQTVVSEHVSNAEKPHTSAVASTQLQANSVESTEAGLSLKMKEYIGIAAEGIDDRVVEALYQEELLKLRRAIYDKLIEKEMPVLLKSQKIELAKDIQKRVESLYADEMEQQEREAMRQAIVERLKREEYPILLKEEQDRQGNMSSPRHEDSNNGSSVQPTDPAQGLESSIRRQLRSEMNAEIITEYREIMAEIEQLTQSMQNVEALRSLSETVRLLTEQQQKQPDFKLDATETESLLHYLKRVQGRLQAEVDAYNAAVHTLVPRIDKIMNNLNEEDRNIA